MNYFSFLVCNPMKRRFFLKNTAITGLGLAVYPSSLQAEEAEEHDPKPVAKFPTVVATWKFSQASFAAGQILDQGGAALDAVEQGVRIEEANLENSTVGKGGAPDREGNVTLDACIMAPNGNAGSVAYLKNNAHAVSVARKVMEETPHVMLVGEGADQFARQQGFEKENLLTAEANKNYQEWLKEKEYKPIINIENHDTIGMLCIDKEGDISGACTTSGLAYKMNGRVGDSPIIGAGLYVDNEIGGAVATGMGEAIMKAVGSFLVVELMRQGKSPQQACEEVIKRIVSRNSNYKDFQAAFVALNKQGEVGSFAIHEGFSYMHYKDEKNKNCKSAHYS